MKRLLILCSATIISCTSTRAQKSSEMQNNAKIIVSESQGGAENVGFRIITNNQDFQKAIRGNSIMVDMGTGTDNSRYNFPNDKKVVLYNLGMFRSGDHRISEIKSVSVKNDILYVEVPYVEHGGMEIQVISNPYIIFTVPSDYQFSSVELKYSK